MGTGNELALDMSDLETEKNRIPNSNLKNLIEKRWRDDTNLTIVKIDDVEIEPNLRELKKGNFSRFFLIL